MEKKDFESEEWQSLIGRAIIASGVIELITYKCLSALPSEHIFEVVADLGFSRRIDLIGKLIEEKPISDKLRKNFLRLLGKAKKSALTRNLIAHNPLMISVYEQEETGDLLLLPEIEARRKKKAGIKKKAIRKKDKVLNLNGMRKFTAEVEKLSLDLDEVWGKVFVACGSRVKK